MSDPYVFISYSRQDRQFVEHLTAKLALRSSMTKCRGKACREWCLTGAPFTFHDAMHPDVLICLVQPFVTNPKTIDHACSRLVYAFHWRNVGSYDALMSHAKASTPRCLTTAQRRAFFLPPEPPQWCIELEKWPYRTDAWKEWLRDTRAGKSPTPPSSQ